MPVFPPVISLLCALQGLRSKFAESSYQGKNNQQQVISWAALGRSVAPLFLAAPQYLSFASGIDKEVVPREARVRARRVTEDLGPAAKPMELQQTVEANEEGEGCAVRCVMCAVPSVPSVLSADHSLSLSLSRWRR